MELPEKTGGDFVPCPQGTFPARCVRFIDLGSHEQFFEGQSKGKKRLVLITWELPTEKMEDGRPFTISKRYTWSMHEKSALRKDLESWRGKRFGDSDFGPGGFNVKKLLDVGATITVSHRDNDGTIFSNVTAIGGMMKGMELPDRINPLTYVALKEGDFVSMDFDTLSDGLQEKIRQSPEWARLHGQDLQSNKAGPEHDERNPPAHDGFDDEVPF